MQRYVCHKEVNAKPMTRKEYNDLRGWVVPPDEDQNDDGYLVEYIDGGQANHRTSLAIFRGVRKMYLSEAIKQYDFIYQP